MAVDMKRKQATEDTAARKSKRQKSDRKATNGEKSELPPTTTKPTTTSILAKEQPAFPRGGAGLLTPLEKKQISARAARDAIAEQGKTQDLFGPSQRGPENSDSEGSVTTSKIKQDSAVKRKKQTKRNKVIDASEGEATVAIEGLSYKRLAVGSLILGRVSSVNSQDLTISLPNNLSGFVPLTSISATFTKKLQGVLDEDGDQITSGSQHGAEDISVSLESHFVVGQYLRVAVTGLGEEATGKTPSKKRILLSVDPKYTNIGLTRASLITGCTVQAAVTSVEDHGLVVDLGIQDENETLKAFIPAKALGSFVPLNTAQPGTVMLCCVTSAGSHTKVVKLSAELNNGAFLKSAPSIDAFLPGTPVEVLISEVSADGIAGKVMGLLDVTADIIHSGSYKDRETFVEKYNIGQKIKARLLCTFPLSENKKMAFSCLEHIVRVSPGNFTDETSKGMLKIASILPSVRIVRAAPGLGVFASLPAEQMGFIHVSRLSDKKVDTVSETTGAYKLGSEHKARVLDLNLTDGLYILSLQNKIIEQPFLRVEDVAVGETVKVTIEKTIIGAAGVQGLIVKLAEGVTGLVPSIHMSDTTLLHPEKKFREGQAVTARILSVDPVKKQSRLTLKKTLVNSDQQIWKTFSDVVQGQSTVGTLVKIDPPGALVQFFGNVRGFLPVAEMSEAYIKDATEHFKVGQVLTVNALSVNAAEERLTVSCRDRGTSLENSFATVTPGTRVSGIVFEKSQADILLRLDGSDVIARLPLDHVSDGSEKKRRSVLDRIRVGQKLEDVLVLDVQRTGRLVILCNRQSLVKAAQTGQFIKNWEDLKEDALVTGFVSNITESGVFVQFAGGISGLITKKHVPVDSEDQADFGLTLFQAVTARVTSIDYRGAKPRFWLSMRQRVTRESKEDDAAVRPTPEIPQILHPVDESITSFADFTLGKLTKARITSIKSTQINVELAKDIQGRIDVSEVFDEWSEIKDRKQPLSCFNQKQILTVRILGAHDTRNHRFLPLSHRAGTNTVFELSAKPNTLKSTDVQPLSLSDMQAGSSWLVYVNNIVEDCLMVNVSPTVRGRIRAIDVSDDLSLAADLENNFPIGSAIRARVKSVNLEKNHLDLTGKLSVTDKSVKLQELSPGTVLPGRVTKIADNTIFVQLADDVVGGVHLIDMADDYAQSNTARYQKNDIIRVCVIKVDIPNKKIFLSARPSKVLSSAMKVADPEVTTIEQLKVGDVVRGFVTNVADKGLFIMLGHGITAFVRVTNLSDTFLKSWKDSFQRDQLIKGKVISVDEATGHVQLSLKESVITGTYKPPITFASLHIGDTVTGKVVKVETFGVFILVDNSENVRGLCHRSEIAEQRIEDVSKLFNQGDVVKAKVLKIDLANRRINFGMKASYFLDDVDETMDDVDDLDVEGDDSDDGGVDFDGFDATNGVTGVDEDATIESDDEGASSDEESSQDEASDTYEEPIKQVTGLSVGGFDWSGLSNESTFSKRSAPADVDEPSNKQKKQRRKPEIQVDRTGDLDVDGPHSTDDFERLILKDPDSSMLRLQHMAFHMELGDVDAARQVGERALKDIDVRQESEKLNIWDGLLKLENAYGDDDSIETTFKRSLEYNDDQEMYNRLVSIYIQSGKRKKADDLFQEMLKKFTQVPKVYVNYATFLFDTMNDADRGRAQLTRALQVLPSFTHVEITSKFAQLEFKYPAGLPERGRTIFEGLLNNFPKRVDLFNILLDFEIKQEDKDVVRALFERIFGRKLKPKQAKHFFKRWLAFEEAEGDERSVEEVKARAATWIKKQE